MDRKDVYEIGNDIMNAVNDAVGTGDFTGLNETLKNVTGAAACRGAAVLPVWEIRMRRAICRARRELREAGPTAMREGLRRIRRRPI